MCPRRFWHGPGRPLFFRPLKPAPGSLWFSGEGPCGQGREHPELGVRRACVLHRLGDPLIPDPLILLLAPSGWQVKDLVGKTVDIPSSVFNVDVPDMFYTGRVLGPDSSHANSVIVKLRGDPAK